MCRRACLPTSTFYRPGWTISQPKEFSEVRLLLLQSVHQHANGRFRCPAYHRELQSCNTLFLLRRVWRGVSTVFAFRHQEFCCAPFERVSLQAYQFSVSQTRTVCIVCWINLHRVMMHLEFAKPLQQFTDLAKQGRTRVLPKNKLFRWALSGSGHVNNCQREREQRIVKKKKRQNVFASEGTHTIQETRGFRIF